MTHSTENTIDYKSPDHHEHPDELRTYLAIFFTLMGLLVLTVLVYLIPFEKVEIAGINFGFMNTVIALTIAFTKAGMVMLFFMHLRHSTKLTWIIASAGFVWLGIMVVFTFADYQSRGDIRESAQEPIAQMHAVAMER